jgi:hypothetical protein
VEPSASKTLEPPTTVGGRTSAGCSVSVRGCALVGVEGIHASGKATLVHALTAHYRERGVLVDCTGEPARTSPFIEETVIHGKGVYDLATEVDLYAAHLSATLRGARQYHLLICDKDGGERARLRADGPARPGGQP